MSTNGFELVRDEHIEEINTKAKLYRHTATGTELLSLENDDENKVFGVTFRTPPKDSTGIAHIMEHSVLCGSRKYPLKEPFIELVKGSLNTFLNAMTYPDKTTYPVASQNTQDFYNLVDVYMDAVFHPLIPKETLEQEGWHYELDDPKGELTFKGVVFNEMKGVYSSPDSLLYRQTQQSLFPDVTYGFDSGGDPAAIPDLTYEQFKAFHETYYHPSNARLYFYGDDEPERRLEQANAYLKEFERLEVDSSVALQERFGAPKSATIYYEAGEDASSKKSMMTLSWMLPENNDRELSMLLGLLSYILVGTPASPLRKALLESGLGEALTGGGLGTHLRQMYFSTGLKGIEGEDCQKVETLILDTLRKIADEGLSSDLIEAALNMTEFHLRENNTGSYPRGLSLMLHTMSTWLHDQDPMDALRYEDLLQASKDTLADPSGKALYHSAPLQALIRDHLLQNQHRVTVLLSPKEGVQKEQEEAEKKRLQETQAKMDEGTLEEVAQHTKELKERQERPDPPELLAKLPNLQLADLDKENKTIPIEKSEEQGAEILYHDLFTNHIVYLDLAFDLEHLPQELLPYMSLFGQALVEIGTKEADEVQIAQRIRRKTGGIWSSSLLASQQETREPIYKMLLRGKVAVDKMDELLDIIKDLLLTVNFDNKDKFLQMVRKSKAGHESGLIPGGHGVANTRLRARLGGPDQIAETTGGVEKLFFLRDLLQRVEQDWPSVLATLERIRGLLVNRNTMLCNVTTDEETWKSFQPQLKAFLDALPAAEVKPESRAFDFAPIHEGLILPAQVNYVAKGANLYDLGYKAHGSVAVISKFLRTSWLWEKVRMQGGAYGGMCRFSRRTGIFSFLSYRDPNLLGTLENFDQSAHFLQKLELNENELTRGIVGTVGDIDSYQLPDSKGYSSMVYHLVGESDEFRQQLREEVLSTTLDHFHQFGQQLEALNDKGLVVVLGSQSALEEANATLDPKMTLTKVL